MKIQIDTNLKTITIEEEITLKELSDFLTKLFSDRSWENYKLIPKTISTWDNPIIITYPTYPSYPSYPNQPIVPEFPNWPIITCDTNMMSSGTYNIEIEKPGTFTN